MQGNPHKAQAYGNPMVDTPNKSVDGGGVVGRTLDQKGEGSFAGSIPRLRFRTFLCNPDCTFSEARSYCRRRRVVY